MLDWLIFGCIFNLIYYWFRLDFFILKVTLNHIEETEEKYLHLIDVGTKDRLEKIKKSCKNYEKEVQHSFLTVCLDLVIFPYHMLALLFAFGDYIIMRNRK